MECWQVLGHEEKEGASCLRLGVNLPCTQMRIERDFILVDDASTVQVVERMKNLVSFERAIGRAQHVTFGEAFLADGVLWDCNADKGVTWPKEYNALKIMVF